MDGKRYRSVVREGGVCGRDGVWRGGGGRDGGVCCLLEVPEGCSCQINILQWTLEGVKVVGDKCIRWMSVPQ